MATPLRILFAAVALCTTLASRAQLLFVNDNDYITYNTDTILHDLAAAGIAVDVYDVAAQGAPPTLAQMYDYPGVIWYCSGDGAGLGLWNDVQDLSDLAAANVPIWFIGTDMLYAGFGNTPVTFAATDLPSAVMGLQSYDVQSYGDDGGAGCAELDVTPAAASAFAPTVQWSFSTLWWVDGCTPAMDGADAIYTMGPMSYALQGYASMVHAHNNGQNVMSSFFDPALIDTYENRLLFLQQTVAYMALSTGVTEASVMRAPLLTGDGAGGAFLTASMPLRAVEVYGVNGQLEQRVSAANADRVHLDGGALARGLHVVTAISMDGVRSSVKWAVP